MVLFQHDLGTVRVCAPVPRHSNSIISAYDDAKVPAILPKHGFP